MRNGDARADEGGPGLLESMWRFRWMTVGVVALLLLLAAAVSMIQATRYAATTTVVLSDMPPMGLLPEGGGGQDLSRTTATQAELIMSERVLRRTAQLLGGEPDASTLRDTISVTPAPDSGLIDITAEAGDAELAATIADTTAQAYEDVNRELVLQRAEEAATALEQQRADLASELEGAQQALSQAPDDLSLQARRDSILEEMRSLGSRASDIATSASLYGAGVEYVEPAQVPDDPVQPQPLRNLAAALLLGLLVAGPVAWMRADRSRPVEHSEMAAELLGAPLLGEVPRLRSGQGMAVLTDVRAMPGEAYQVVTAGLQYVLDTGVVLVTSAAQGDGKTVAAANIAAAAARDGRRVVVVDSDGRVRGLTRLLGADPGRAGLFDVALRRRGLGDVVSPLPLTDEVALDVVLAGHPVADIGSLFRTDGMADAMEALRSAYDLVIVDCPPLLAVSDAASLAAHGDGMVIVVNRGTPSRVLVSMRQRLSLIRTPLLGYVFNRGEAVVPAYGGYGHGGDPAARTGPVAATQPAATRPALTRRPVTGPLVADGDAGGRGDADDAWEESSWAGRGRPTA